MYICMFISICISGLDSAYERTCNVSPFEHGLLCLTSYIQFYAFSCKCHISFFVITE
jgi:hypothetical protein